MNEGDGPQRVRLPPGNWVAPAGSYRSGGGGNEAVEAFETTPRCDGVASPRVVTLVNAEQAPKVPNVGADPLRQWGRPPTLASRSPAGIRRPTSDPTQRSHRGIWRRHADTRGSSQHGKPQVVAERIGQPDAREGQAGPPGVADRFVVPRKPGNAGRGKGPEFQIRVRGSRESGDWR
jgi:hypothetical protein